MLYVIVDKADKEKVLLVKANDWDEVEAKVKLSETQGMVGSFTSYETDTLVSATFAVVSG